MSKWFPEPVMRISLTIVLFMLAGSAYAQPSVVTFCDLLRHADKYNGKEVSLRATYRYGFEWQELFCLDCMDKGKAWLDIPSDLNDASARSLRKAPKGAGIVNLTLQGIFVSGGHFGHMGYQYKIVAHEIRDVAILQKGMKSLSEEEKIEKRWACGGSNPK